MNIEKGVPMPTMVWSKYQFGHMEIGDSVVGDERFYTALKQWARRKMPGWKLTRRAMGDGQYRIWRAA